MVEEVHCSTSAGESAGEAKTAFIAEFMPSREWIGLKGTHRKSHRRCKMKRNNMEETFLEKVLEAFLWAIVFAEILIIYGVRS